MKPIIKIVEIDGTEIEREMNDEEYAQLLKDQAEYQIKVNTQNEFEATRAALLNKLGITQEEAKLLLGGN